MWNTFCIQTFCIHFVCKSLSKCGIRFIYKHFVYIKVVEMWDTFCIQTFCIYFLHILYTKCMQKVVKMWDTFGIQTFCIHFAHILYTKYIQKIVEMWDPFCICPNILYTFCIHQFWSTKSVHHQHVYNLYTKSIQNVNKNNCIQIGSLISTYFDLFVVHFWLIIANNEDLKRELPIKSMDQWIIYYIKLPVIRLNKSNSPCVSEKNAKFV